jgi:hypothetical protein
VAARTRQARLVVARLRSGTRGVLDPLVAWAGTTEVITTVATPEPTSSLRDDPPTLPSLDDVWAISVSNTPAAPPPRKPTLLALSDARPEGRVEAP